MVWSCLASSVTGTSHNARSVPCQDAHRICPYGPEADWIVVAIADGAGSALHAEVGARLCCDELVRRVESAGHETLFSQGELAALFSQVRLSLVSEAERLEVSPRELACTAILGIVAPDHAIFAQIGDGAIVIRLEDAPDHRVVFWPEANEYANATNFLTDDSFEHNLRVSAVDGRVNEFAALTDGLQRLALDFSTQTAFAGFFQPLFRRLRDTDSIDTLSEAFCSFLDSDQINSRTDDDKTLVLAVR